MMRLCPDCGVGPGQQHLANCDVARCLFTGGQRLQCEFFNDDEWIERNSSSYIGQVIVAAGIMEDNPPHDCGEDIWTGVWPGVTECAEFDWWCRMVPGLGWTPCDKSEPDAMPDLNRLYIHAKWSRERERFILT